MTNTTPEPHDSQDQAHYVYLNLLLEAGCKFLARTVLFGKEYVWMKDRTGNIFLERLPNIKKETP